MKMKNIALLTLLIVCIFTVNTAAQFTTPKQENELKSEQKMLPFAMGMSLAVLSARHNDNFLAVITMLQSGVRHYSAELKPVVELKADENEEIRRETVAKALKELQTKSSQTDRWQMLMGSYFGDIFVELKKAEDTGKKVDSNQVKFLIEAINALEGGTPAEIPWNVQSKIKEFGKLSKIKDFSTKKNDKLLRKKVLDILDEIMK